MEDLSGYYGEKDGVQVIVLKIPYTDVSYADMLRIAIEVLREE